MKIVRRILLILAGFVVLIALLLAFVGYTIVTPERVTPLVVEFTQKHVKSDVSFDQIDITLFSSFPDVGIILKNGCIIDEWKDTLLAFNSCELTMNVAAYFKRNRISVKKINLDQPRIYAHILPDGKVNWDILPVEVDTTTTTAAVVTADTSALNLGIRNFTVNDATIVYDDEQTQQLLELEKVNMKLSGRLRQEILRLTLDLSADSISFWNAGQQFCSKIPVKLSAKLRQNQALQSVEIDTAALSVAGVDFTVDGNMQWDSTSALHINSRFDLNSSSVAEVLTHIPKHLSTIQNRLSVAGSIDIKGSFNGTFSEKSVPVLDAELSLANGRIRSAKHPQKTGIEKLELKGRTHIDLNNTTPSTFRLENLLVQSASSKLQFSGEATDLFTEPFIRTTIDADINFTRLAHDLSLTDSTITMKGFIRADLSGESYMSHIMNKDLGKIKLNGEINIDSVLFDAPQQQTYIAMSLLSGRFGTNTQDSVRGRLIESLLRGRLTAESMTVKWEDINGSIRALSASFSTSAPADSLSVAPVFTNLRVRGVNLRLDDSTRLRTANASGSIRMTPLPGTPAKPLYNVRLSLDTLRYRMPAAFTMINSGRLNVRMSERQPIRRTTARTTVSTGRQANRDSSNTSGDSVRTRTPRARTTGTRTIIARYTRNSAANTANVLDMRLDSGQTRDVLQNWNINGNFECKNVRVRTPYFPLRTSISEGNIDFSTDSLKIKHLDFKAGESTMQINGNVSGIRQALLRNGRIRADINLLSDTLNLNQLTVALVSASKFSELKDTEKDELTKDLEQNDVVVTNTEETGVFVVPRNIDLKIHGKIGYTRYSNLNIDGLNSDIIVRNNTLEMPDMALKSNIGDMKLSLVYKAENTKSAHIGMDLDLQQIQVKELISSFPVLDSLTPMLRSFEGVVNCNMTAVTDLDSLMGVIFPTATASCLLSGKNLVLMDGETFTDIAKTLWFKNKQRNLIDSMQVELILEDNQLLIFPFLLSIDRYQVAVGGTQRLDRTFDYHISVIKSPIPFKFGVNLIGNPDDFKIRLAKAKYKDLFKPAKTESLEGAKFNVRTELQAKLRENIQNIVNTTPAVRQANRRRQRTNVNNDMRRYLMTDNSEVVSDTTAVDTEAMQQQGITEGQ